jgi:hypothetical protein
VPWSDLGRRYVGNNGRPSLDCDALISAHLLAEEVDAHAMVLGVTKNQPRFACKRKIKLWRMNGDAEDVGT